MGIFKKKLNVRLKMLAVQVAREHFAASGGNKIEFERLVRSDSRVSMIDPMLIILFIKIAYQVFEYFRNRPVNGTISTTETDAEVYANSLRYEE
jgi:hypothetical protein